MDCVATQSSRSNRIVIVRQADQSKKWVTPVILFTFHVHVFHFSFLNVFELFFDLFFFFFELHFIASITLPQKIYAELIPAKKM